MSGLPPGYKPVQIANLHFEPTALNWELPHWATAFVEFFANPHVLLALSCGSVLLFIMGILGVPWFVNRIPPDYFSREEQQALGLHPSKHPLLKWLLHILRNLLGGILLLLGVLMLVLPGPGLMAILVSLILLNFPRKRRFLRWLIHIPVFFNGMNAIRIRAGKKPLHPLGAPKHRE